MTIGMAKEGKAYLDAASQTKPGYKYQMLLFQSGTQ